MVLVFFLALGGVRSSTAYGKCGTDGRDEEEEDISAFVFVYIAWPSSLFRVFYFSFFG